MTVNARGCWNCLLLCGFFSVILMGIITCFTGLSFASDFGGQKQKRIVDSLVEKWQGMYGPVDFAEHHLFQCMLYIHPQPKNAFIVFESQRLSDEIRRNHRHWLDKMFKGSLYECMKNIEPSKFYVNEGRVEPSLLLFELEIDKHTVTIMENYNVFFLIFRPIEYDMKNGMKNQQIAEILLEWIRLPYIAKDDVINGFRLQRHVRIGEQITNRTQPRISIIRDWKDYIIGFVSIQGICVALFKADGARSQLGFPYDFDWLNKGLYEQNGIKLLDPPVHSSNNELWHTK